MIDWLKSTIPGIVILGAIGCIIAVGILRVSALIVARVLTPAVGSAIRVLLILRNGPNQTAKYLHDYGTTREIVAGCALFMVLTVFNANLALAGFLLPAFGALGECMGDMRNRAVFVGSLASCASAIMAGFLVRTLWVLYFKFQGRT
jgi:hypothetical protein